MKWIGKRISFMDDKDKATIVIYPEDVTWVKGVMGAWVGMWYAIGGTVIWSYYTLPLTNQENIIIFVFLAFWLYYAVRVTRSFLWLLWGKELIKIDEVAVYYKKSIKKYGKSQQFFLENISKIGVSQPKEKSVQSVWEKSPWIKGGERIEFDYQNKVIRLGRKLKQKDAEQLFKFIIKKVEARVRKLKN
ncbi:MAG: hypothetical protein QNK23_03445 [Crocinitomicaceae bacterium]|nr:hypothetical protein [Crocinitomicaceae bacterium]